MTWVASVDPGQAASHLAQIASAPDLSPDALVALSSDIVRWSREARGDVALSVLRLVRERRAVDAERLDRLEVLSGRADANTEARVIAACTSASRSDLVCLGAMASGAHGEDARAALLRAFASRASPADLVAALDRAVAELRAARAEKEERALVAAVRDAARDADPKLRALLRPDAWPAAPRVDVLRASEVERRVSTSGL
jgi:hypothetical protein